MIWTWLRSCYGFKMRIYIGGRETIVPARWYFCAPGALPFPFPHGMESSPWLKNYERENFWGEVTPYPTDRDSDYSRIVDRGKNPGYPGLCYVGQDQWFIDGKLPANVEDGPIPPFPECCYPTPATSSGGLVLGGSAIATGHGGYLTRGGLVLGGSATAVGARGYASAGGLVLGGSAIAGGGYRTAGGLVLGGSATPGAGGQPGGDCQHAGDLSIEQSSPPQSFAVGQYWWQITLVGGQTYHVLTANTSQNFPLYWSIFAGTCANLTVLANDGWSCTQFVAPYSGSFPIQVTVPVDNPGTWTIGVFNGPCP
jgi:hypothetical protein